MDIFSSVNVLNKKMDFSFTKIFGNRDIQSEPQMHDEKSKEEIQRELQKTMEQLNKTLNTLNTDLEFRFNDKVGELVVEVIDKKSDKVIREFPPKEALRLMEKVKELVGLLFDKKG